MDDTLSDAELAEWLRELDRPSPSATTIRQLDFGWGFSIDGPDLNRLIHALQAARERIAELEDELAWRLGPWRNED
jgi:hypothetical protein